MLGRASCSQSYSAWRYSVLRQLLQGACGPCQEVDLPFLHPESSRDRTSRRRFHTSSYRLKPDSPTRSDTRGASSSAASSEDAHQQDLSQNGPGVIRRVNTRHNGEEAPVSQQEGRGKGSRWKPTTPTGRRTLRGLVEALKQMAEQAETSKQESTGRRGNIANPEERSRHIVAGADDVRDDWTGDSKQDRLELSEDEFPVSPLEVRMQNRKWQAKREPTLEEKERLASNPWAAMLAGPMRQDAASRTRFPAALLLDIGQVSNPEDQRVYVLPDHLADLELFSKKLKNGNRGAATKRSSAGEDLRILPYRLGLEELSDAFMVWDTTTSTGRTQKSAVARRLFPVKWHEKAQKINAYHNASKEYWEIRERNGELDNGLFKKPEKGFEAANLQWQPAIIERIPNIMRQRVLLALNQVAQRQNIPKDKMRTHTICFAWPDQPTLNLEGEFDEQRLPPEQDFWNDMGDIESGDAITGTGSRQGNSSDPRPPIAMRPSEISQDAPPIDNNGRPDKDDPRVWLPGSFILHIGPPSASLSVLKTTSSSTATSPNNAMTNDEYQHNKFVPPMMNIVGNPQRLPIFNLDAMLGPKLRIILDKVLARHQHLRFRHAETENDEEKSIDSDQTNYLILVKSVAPCSHFLAQELWQLWRYLGGTDCLFVAARTQKGVRHVVSSTVAAGADAALALPAGSHERVQRSKPEYQGLSDRAWEHLHDLLGLKRRIWDEEVVGDEW